MEFTVATDTRGNGEAPFSGYSLVANSPRLNVIGSSAVKLVVTVPSIVSIKESFPVTVVARDKYNNVADRCNENIKLTLNESPSSQSYSIKLNEGRGEIKGVKCNQAGKKRIEASDPLNSLNGKSNPMLVNDKNGFYRIYWGDIHGHTILSDGLGTLEEYYDYGREIANLDFCSTADHDCQISDEDWERTKEINIKSNDPGNFITFSGYEFSHNPPGLPYYGDKCIYYPTDDKPLYRSTDITESEWADLKEVGEKLKKENALMILHQHARGTCSYYEADLVRLVEIYSIHGASEYWGNPLQILSPYVLGPREFRGDSVQDALAKGWRLGIIAGSDCHAGHPGYSDWLRVRKAYHGGIAGVYARELTREAIWKALWNRSCYGTTGVRIIMDFKVNNRMMGEEFTLVSSNDPRIIQASVIGTEDIQKLELIKNNAVIYTYTGIGISESFEFCDDEELKNTAYYYLRVTQKDGHMAWCSPIWVNPAGKR